jgi:DNA repair exonuclease SbcCD ATPase subunit
MITSLVYNITFANDKNISRDLTFSTEGSTLITGPNEAGKSLNLEMIAYALFGNEALRGKTTDYKRISCKLAIQVNGKTYRIERVKSNAKLFTTGTESDEQLATGITPVNALVMSLLGFDYAVYKIAHLAAQGDLQALAAMKPTERKAMVDTVAGLNQLDDVLVTLGNDIKIAKVEVTATEGFVTRVTEPTAPAQLLEDLNAKKLALQQQGNEIYQAQAIRQPSPVYPTSLLQPLTEPQSPQLWDQPCEPQAPVMPNEYSPETLVQLNGIVSQLKEHRTTLAKQLDHPELTLPEVQAQYALIELAKRATERDSLLAKGSLTCSNCGHENHLASALLASYDDVPATVIPATFEITALYRMEGRLDALDTLKQQQLEAHQYVDSYGQFEETERDWSAYAVELKNYQQQHTQWTTEVTRILATNTTLKNNYDTQLSEVQNHNQGLATRNTEIEKQNRLAQETYQRDLDTYTTAQLSITAEIVNQHREVTALVEQGITQWSAYAQNMVRYHDDVAKQTVLASKIAELKGTVTDLENARKALKQTKTDVKSYLTPALSRVASQLLSEMTGGVRNTVAIDEDFDVLVDGQPLRTLSGSGKDIVNLAIRIALGQVLTHKVLPMMCLDEIDQGMDADRARYTQECLQRITPQVGQMLIVSHRPSVSDHVLTLG